jgi:hypothetical protein
MQISEKKIREFQELWEKNSGEKISQQMAVEKANKLLLLVRHTYKPIKKKDLYN